MSYVIDFKHLVAVLAVMVAPSVATLLATPGAARLPHPVGVAAWRADSSRLPDPVRITPAAVHDFLAATGAAGQHELAARHPGVVGTLDGAPPALRYAANRLAGAPRDGQILLFDPRGDGRVAQVFGDLATADRIAVLVPGAANRVDNFWTGVGGERYRSPAVQAADLYEATHDGRIAVFGSPGMGVHDVTKLGSHARVWAGQSEEDWIRWVPGIRLFGLGHGTKPADPDFDARVFHTADVTGHDRYLSPGTDSLAALARIVEGARP